MTILSAKSSTHRDSMNDFSVHTIKDKPYFLVGEFNHDAEEMNSNMNAFNRRTPIDKSFKRHNSMRHDSRINNFGALYKKSQKETGASSQYGLFELDRRVEALRGSKQKLLMNTSFNLQSPIKKRIEFKDTESLKMESTGAESSKRSKKVADTSGFLNTSSAYLKPKSILKSNKNLDLSQPEIALSVLSFRSPRKHGKKRVVRFDEDIEVHEVENWKHLNKKNLIKKQRKKECCCIIQ